MDFKRLKEWFETVQGIVTAAATAFGLFTLAWATTTKAVDSFIVKTLGLPAWTAHVAVILVVLALVGSVWRSFRGFARASRIERSDAFTLRPTTPEALIGRAKDLDGLLNAVKRSRLVLLDGESGCGKSALVTAGLLPRLQQVDSLLPVVIRDWGEDWARGPLTAALDALHHGVSQPDRDRLDWTSAPDLAADTSGLVAQLDARMQRVVDTLGRRPLLIADQFDDYQAGHRQRFLDEEANWLSPTAVAKTNPFWELVSNGLSEGHLHVLIVSRADTAAGLACMRFLGEDQTAVRTLPRVDVEYLRQLLASIARDDAQPVIVSHPAGGWDALRDLLERDLKPEGAILMQQVRAVLLGLRQLKVLTPARYRTAGGLRGVETLFIERALERAGRALGGGETGVRRARAVLGALVLPGGPNQAPKAQRAVLSELSALAGDASCAEAVLAVLQQEEVVRPAETIGDAHAWQLDHDYLARAVTAEARQADRWAVELREGKARYDTAYGLRPRWASLLSASKLARICWERARGRLTFGDAAGYARLSAVRPALVTLLVTLAGVGAYHWNQERVLTQEALHIVDRFGGDSADEAVLTVWRAPEPLRMRVYELVRADPGRVERAVRDGWPLAHAGFEPARVREAAALLRERIDRGLDRGRTDNFYDPTRSWPNNAAWRAYPVVVARMTDAVDVRAEAAALRARLGQVDAPGIVHWPANAYLAVVTHLDDAEDLKAEATALGARLAQQHDERMASQLVAAYGAVVMRLRDAQDLRIHLTALRELLARARAGELVVRLASTYAAVAVRLDDADDLKAAAAALNALLGQELDRSWGANVAIAHAAVVARLRDQEALRAEAIDLRERLVQERDRSIARNLASAYADLAVRLTDTAERRAAAATLRGQIKAEYQGWSAAHLAANYVTIATQLNDLEELNAGSITLRTRWKQEGGQQGYHQLGAAYATIAAALHDTAGVKEAAVGLRTWLAQDRRWFGGLTEAQKSYAGVVARLSDAAARAEATELRALMAKEQGPWGDVNFTPCYAAIAARLSSGDAQVEAAALLSGLQQEQNSSILSSVAQAYAAVAARLHDPGVAKIGAAALRTRIEQEPNPRLIGSLATAYAAAAVELDDVADVRLAARVLRTRLEQNRDGWIDSELVDAYATVAARLTDPTDAKLAAATLHSLLGRQDHGDKVDSRVHAYSLLAAHLQPSELNAEAAALRLRLEAGDAQRMKAFTMAYGAVSRFVLERGEPTGRSSPVREILTLAGQPFIDDVTPLLAALKPAAGRDFGANTGDAVRWAERTYGIKPEQLRPPPVAH